MDSVVCVLCYRNLRPRQGVHNSHGRSRGQDGRDRRFVNAQGTDNGNFSSYGVLEFDTTTLAGTMEIPALQFSLTQANAFFTESGDISFFHMGDNAADLTPAGTLRSDPNAVPSAVPVENSLGLTLLGTGTFTEVETGTVDNYTFSINDSIEATILARIAEGDSVRFLFAAAEATTSATYAGLDGGSDGSLSPPQIAVVPEPSSMTILAFAAGLVPWLRRRKRA